MTKPDSLETGKIVVALRAARAAAGWSQEEFAQLMGVAKTSVARIETLEMSARALDRNVSMTLLHLAS